MKIIKYLTAVLIALFAWSCADEGPEIMGKFEITHSVNIVKCRSAQVIITLPKSDDQMIQAIGACWLVGPDGETYYSDYDLDNDTGTALTSEINFKQLVPSTTYTIMVSVYGSFNYENDSNPYYYDGEELEMQLGTLTTLSESDTYTTDYLLVSNDCAAFNLSLEMGLSDTYMIEQVFISDNPEMNNPAQLIASLNDKINGRPDYYNRNPDVSSVCTSDNADSKVTITIKGLTPGTKYYYAVEMRDGRYYNVLKPGNNSFTTLEQPAEILKSTTVSPKLELVDPEYDTNWYTFTCAFDFGTLNVRNGVLFLSGSDINDALPFYGDKGISQSAYLYNPGPICYSLGLIVDIVKDGVKYTANGITYTPEDNVIQIPSAK